MTQAVFQTGGKQYTVSPGDELLVELLSDADSGEVRFDDVRLTVSDSGTQIGTPRVDGAAVVASLLGEVKGAKVRSVKFRRRKDSQTVKGHRQKYHRIRVTSIEGV